MEVVVVQVNVGHLFISPTAQQLCICSDRTKLVYQLNKLKETRYIQHTLSINEKDPAELLAFLIAIIFASKSTENTHIHAHTILTATSQVNTG